MIELQHHAESTPALRISVEADMRNPILAALSRARGCGVDLTTMRVSCPELGPDRVAPEHALLDEVRIQLHAMLEHVGADRARWLHARLIAGTFLPTLGTALGLHVPLENEAEAWFCLIGRGDTPENSHACAIATIWVESWLAAQRVVGELGAVAADQTADTSWQERTLAEVIGSSKEPT